MYLIVSMTGYGRAQTALPTHKLLVEMRSVNHRFAEVVVRLPREWMELEERVRKLVQAEIARGRVEVYITVTTSAAANAIGVEVDRDLLARALRLIHEVSVASEVDFEPPSIGDLLAIPGLFRTREDDLLSVQEVEEPLFATVKTALSQLLGIRQAEGKHLTQHLEQRLQELSRVVLLMEQRAPQTVQLLRDKLLERLRQLLQGEVDATRVALEVAIAAERTSVEEEIERLKSHIMQFRKLVESQELAVGRRLDFLLQEMNREVNTIGSKCADLAMTDAVLLAKHGIEQMREQVQNAE
ncbi:YicC/YloC family endoribonuclease [Sulfoacidibacillus thermotolerans]|uniref:YicC/YloC family endoribonuclease n=1 Tax=Sulfoacidibacillus thermotolerans TaxID=1765684 RepID=UPI000D6A047B|nr:YicC/YloC family endoribonuclease [Sulfoacidibacillus thermotolerans]